MTSPMALVMLIPRGHASMQLKTVRQRQTPIARRGSASLSAPAVARVKDETVGLDDGRRPDDTASLAQNDGQEVVQHAHRMHLVVSSKRSRSAGFAAARAHRPAGARC